MTWDELVEKAKKMGASIEIFCEFISMGDVFFWNNGEVNILGATIAKHRTPEQMLMIIEALK